MNTTPLLPSTARDVPRAPTVAAGMDTDDRLRRKAAELEAIFLSEMLGHAGLGLPSGEFSGGIGEEQFASFLRNQQAKAIVEAGGIGLTERLFRALSAAPSEANHGG